MGPSGKSPKNASSLRQQAEAVARDQVPASPPTTEPLSPEATQKVLLELQVYTIELELQNEELRRAQLELGSSQARYFDLYDLAPVGYCTISRQGLILEANLTAAGLLRVSRAAMVHQPVSRFIHADDKDLYHLRSRRLLNTGGPATFDLRMRRGDGTSFWGHLVATSDQDTEGSRVLHLVLSDITEQKQAETEQAQQQANLERLNQTLEERVQDTVAELRRKDQLLSHQSRQAAMGEMIGHIAHQWRQPLTGLSMALANLRDAWRTGGVPDTEVERDFRAGNELIQNMSQTITDFRNFFQPDKAREAFSLLGQVKASLSLIDASFSTARISIQIEAASDLRVIGFPNEFSQALLNLFINTRQAIVEAGRPSGRLSLSIGRSGDFGQLTILDDAGGIPEEVIGRIFDPYFTSRPMGSGVGLHMTRQIIEDSMNGKISVRNVEGGAEFTIQLPLSGGDA